MIDDARSRIYAVAIASLSLILAVLIAGICWIAVQHGGPVDTVAHGCGLRATADCLSTEYEAAGVPGELWIALGALGAVFVATLIAAQSQSRRL